MMTGEGLSRAPGGDDEPASERHRRGERVVRRLGGAFMLGMAVMALACGGVLAWMADNWEYPLATAGLIALMFAIAAANWYLGEDQASGDGR